MFPFKPSNGLPYQGPSLAIPSQDESANDRNSVLGRRPYQSSLPNIPNNKKRLSGASQANSKRPLQELPESTKADEQRRGLADGQGIETDRNSLADPNQDGDFFNLFDELIFFDTDASLENPDAEMGLASSSEEITSTISDEFSLDNLLYSQINITSSAEFSNYINRSGHPLNISENYDYLNKSDFLGNSNPFNEDNLLEDQGVEIDFETDPKDSHSAFLSGEPQSLERNANQVEQEQKSRNPSKHTKETRDKILALIKNNGIAMRPTKLREEFIKKYPEESCPDPLYLSEILRTARNVREAEFPELETPWKKKKPVTDQGGNVRDLIEKHSTKITAKQLEIKFINAYPTASRPSLGYFKEALNQRRKKEKEENSKPPKKRKIAVKGQGDRIREIIKDNNILMNAVELREKFIKAYSAANCPAPSYFRAILTQVRRQEQKEQGLELKGAQDKIRAIIEANSILMSPKELQAEYMKRHANEGRLHSGTFVNVLNDMKKKLIKEKPELKANLYPKSKS